MSGGIGEKRRERNEERGKEGGGGRERKRERRRKGEKEGKRREGGEGKDNVSKPLSPEKKKHEETPHHSCFKIPTKIKFNFILNPFSFLRVSSSPEHLTITPTIKFLIPLLCSSGRTFQRDLMSLSMIWRAMYFVWGFWEVERISGTRCQASGWS